MNPTTDDDVAITRWLSGEAPAQAPDGLLRAARTQVRATSQRRGRLQIQRWRAGGGSLRIAVSAAAVVGVVVIAAWIFPRSAGPATAPTSTRPTSPASPSATASPTTSEPILGWPGPRGGPAGRYAWEMFGQAWMHHVADDGTVALWFTVRDIDGPLPSGDPVDIAGSDGTFGERPVGEPGPGVGSHRWVVDIDGRRVVIYLETDPGTIDAALGLVQPIIASMRLERIPDRDGDRLTFELGDGWDSG